MYQTAEGIRPFANGTQFLDWETNNCDRCERDPAVCEVSVALTVACFGDGLVSFEVAKRMGCTDYGDDHYTWPCLEHDPPFDIAGWLASEKAHDTD